MIMQGHHYGKEEECKVKEEWAVKEACKAAKAR
jgi:hypothetical protein